MNNSLETNPVIVIGSKTYQNIDISTVLDSFGDPIRCNMCMPGSNNGNLWGSIYLNIHICDHLFYKRLTQDQFVNHYNTVKESHARLFYNEALSMQSRYKTIYHSSPRPELYNSYLQTFGISAFFTKQPRAGLCVVMDQLLTGKKVYLSHFSISSDERSTYYQNETKTNESHHSSYDEYKILKELHHKGLIDITLCFLSDLSSPRLIIPTSLKPNKNIVFKLLDEFNYIDLARD